ncbi:hypothetical protein FSP39_012181 [Pinctada imbricata]|uniref:Chitin-binding type-4 domain-containing protein n=1 Tax=Pinctada imbricata TaxID=66713 RepID=A0AA89BUL6_PINIB|nr:hypothetical protein FSP39_012181 [Pinctada imbricata]
MLEPSQRSSLWRHGYNTPINRDDDGLNCGGYWHQWQVNGGKCGVCGDPYDVVPRQNEAGGKFATEIISRTYDMNTKYINTVIEVKKNMKGYFEFRLCPDVRMDKPVTQKCLDEHLLVIDGHGDRFYPKQNGIVNLKLVIPSGMQCERCVLQWKWHTAMNWGKCADGSGSKVGCGDQEEYYNCADIAIGPLKSTQRYTPVTVPNPSVLAKAMEPFETSLKDATRTTVTIDTTTEPILPIFDFHKKDKLKKSDVEKFVANKMANDQVHMKPEERTAVLSMMNVDNVPKVEGIILPFLGDKPTGAAVGNSTNSTQDTTESSVKDSLASSKSSMTSNILNQYLASSDFTSTRARRTTRSLPDTSTASIQPQSNNVGSLMGSNVGILTIPGNSVTIDKKTASSSGVLSGPRTVDHQNVVVSSFSNTNTEHVSTSLQNVDQVGVKINRNVVSVSDSAKSSLDSTQTEKAVKVVKTDGLSGNSLNMQKMDTTTTSTLPSATTASTTNKVKANPTNESPTSVKYKAETVRQENGQNVKTQHTVSITVNHTVTHTGTDDDVSHKPVIDVNRLRKIVDFIKKKEDRTNPISVSAKNIFRSNGKSKLSVNSFSGASNSMSKSGQLVKFKISVGDSSGYSSKSNEQKVEEARTTVTTTEVTPTVTEEVQTPSADMGIPISIEKSQSISQTPRRIVTTTSVPQTTTTIQAEASDGAAEKSSSTTEKKSSSVISNNAVIAGIGGFSAGFDQTNAQSSLSLSTGLGGTMNIAGGSLSQMHVPSDSGPPQEPQPESGQVNAAQTNEDRISVTVDSAISSNDQATTKKQMTTTTGQPEQGASYKVDSVTNNDATVVIKSKQQDVSNTILQTSSSLSSQKNSLASSSSLSSFSKTTDDSSDKSTTKANVVRKQPQPPVQETTKTNKDKSQMDFAVVANKMASDTQMRPMNMGMMKETTVITKTIVETSNKNEKTTHNTQKEAAGNWQSLQSDSLQITATPKQTTKKVVTIPTTLPPQTVPSTFSPTSAPSGFMGEGGLADQLLSKPILIKGSINLGTPNSQWQSFSNIAQDQKMVDMGTNFVDTNQVNSNNQFGNSMSSDNWMTMSNSGTSGMNTDLFQSLNRDAQISNTMNSLSSAQTLGSNAGFVPLPPGEIMNIPFGSDASAFQQQSAFDPGFTGFEISGNLNQNSFNQGVSSGVLSTAFDQTLSQSGMDQTLLVAPDSPVYDSSYGPLLSSSGKSGLDAASAFAFVTIPPEPITRRPSTTTTSTTEIPTTTIQRATTTKRPTTTTIRQPSTTTVKQTTKAPITTARPPQTTTAREIPTTTVMSIMDTTVAEPTVPPTTAALTTPAMTAEAATKQPTVKTTESFTDEKNFLQSMFKALTEIMMKVKTDQGKEMAQAAMSRFDNMQSKSNTQTDNVGQNIQTYSEGNTFNQNLDQRNSQSISTSEAFQQDVRRDRIINSQTSSNTNNFINMNSQSSSNSNDFMNMNSVRGSDMGTQMMGDTSVQQNFQAMQAVIPTTQRTTTTTTQATTTTTTPRPVTDALISGLSGLMPRMGGTVGMSDTSNSGMSTRISSDMSARTDNSMMSGLSSGARADTSMMSGFNSGSRADNSMMSGLDSGSSSSFSSSFSSSSSSSSWNPASNSNSASSTSWTQSNNQGIDLMSNIPSNSGSFGSDGISFSGGNVMSTNQDSTWKIMDSQQSLDNTGFGINQVVQPSTQAPSNNIPNFRSPPDTLVMGSQQSQQSIQQSNFSPQIQYQEIPPTYAPPMTTVSPSRNNQLDASLFGTGVAQTSGPTHSSDAAWGLGSSNSNIALTTGGSAFNVQSKSSNSIWKSLASGSNPLDFAAIIQKPTNPPITTPAPTTTTLPPTTPLPMIDVNDLTPQSVDPMNREVMLNMIKSMATTRESLLTLLYTTGGELLSSMGIDPNQIQGSVTTAVVNVVPELRRVLRLPPRRNYPTAPYIPGYDYKINTTSSSTSQSSSSSSSVGGPPGPAAQPVIPTPDPVQRTIETAMAKQMLTMLGLAPEPPDVPTRGRGRGGAAMQAPENIWAAPAGGGGGGRRGGRGRGFGRGGGGMGNDLAMFASAFMDPAEARELGLMGGRGRGGGMGGGMGGGFGGRGGGRRGGGRRQQAVMDAMMEVFGF